MIDTSKVVHSLTQCLAFQTYCILQSVTQNKLEDFERITNCSSSLSQNEYIYNKRIRKYKKKENVRKFLICNRFIYLYILMLVTASVAFTVFQSVIRIFPAATEL